MAHLPNSRDLTLCLHQVLDRRAFLARTTSGLAGVGLASLLSTDLAKATPTPLPGLTHHLGKAKRVLQIFCPGGASHLDLWEHKPELDKYHGHDLPGEEDFSSFQGKNGKLMKSPWPFIRQGQSGKYLSSLLPELGQHADDIAFIHSMTSKTNTHGPGCVFMNTGFATEGFPATGSWLSYALGAENDNLPAYIAITDTRGEPPNGKANWSNGFLPARHQAITINTQTPIRNLSLPTSVSPEEDRATRGLIQELNTDYALTNPGDSSLQARVSAYELAARMQLAAPEASDLNSEPDYIHRQYGTSDPNDLKAAYARNCLLARRFLERGVRYVNLYCASRASGVDGLLNWDAHKTLKSDYERHCPIFDGPTAALLADMKQRGLLDDTLVLWTTEFGRMPTHQEGTTGRDHNPDGFTCWMMGAGIKGGVSHGETDPFGRRAVTPKVTVYDFYATVLHLLGFDHERLTYYHNGSNRRLTDVHGRVLQSILS